MTQSKKLQKIERGDKLVYSASNISAFRRELGRLIKRMQADVMSEVKRVYTPTRNDVVTRQGEELGVVKKATMDASLADLAASLMERMMSKWQPLFDKGAESISEQMSKDALKHSNRTLGASLKDLSKSITLEITPGVKEIMQASSFEASALIKRVPAEYMPNVQQDIMRSITTGNGLQDLIPALEKRNIKVANWADNVAKDQTRKAYASLNTKRLVNAGLKKFEWIHSGGSNEPRKHHMTRAPAGLNGGIFSFDDPPIIDPRTGERGLPGQLPYCGCTMRPVIEFEEKEDE